MDGPHRGLTRSAGNGVTEIEVCPGQPHLMPASPGWEGIADYALSWALPHAR